jgi:hypothetical protein
MSEMENAMQPAHQPGDQFCLYDWHVGRRFTSGTYAVTAVLPDSHRHRS